MSRSNAGNALSLASPPAIHVGPIVTGPGSNETISIVIPLSNAHLTTMANQQKIDKNCKDCGKDTKQQATTAANPTRSPRNDKTKGCPFPTCSRYGRAFSRAHDLKRHIARHAMRKEKLMMQQAILKIDAENAVNDTTLRGTLLRGAESGYFCPRCKKIYSDEDKLKAHLLSHSKIMPKNGHIKTEPQSTMDKSSTAKNSAAEEDFLLEEMLLLKKDPRRMDKGDSKIRCDYCSKTFKTKWTLSSHVAAHEGRFQFDCGQCGKKFVRKSHYEGHVRSHEAARPYVCEQCGKTFKELKHRREHTKRKHPGNQSAIQSLLDSIGPCAAEEANIEQPTKFTLLMPVAIADFKDKIGPERNEMRAKRRRVSSRCRQYAQGCNDVRCTLDTLPPEILGIILRMLSLHDVACIVRLVSRRCSDIAATVLNSEFLMAGTRLEIAMKRTEDLMNSVKTNIELLECNRIFTSLELIRTQYRMLKAVTWRYTHPRSRDLPVSCFYGGKVLDNLNYLLQTVLDPACRGSTTVLGYVDMLFFRRSCENFMDHFEKVTERRVNRSALVSGCKIVDVLDCLAQGRQVLSFRTSSRTGNSTISMQLRYVLKRSWFTYLRVPNVNDEHCWRDKQRYMYLRLRRLVGSYNRHLFHKLHYERSLVLRATAPSLSPRRPPPASTYSGYGEYGGQFFYYGNMSKYAYENRFKSARLGNAENTGGELEGKINRPPQFDLVIGIELRCSPELAPLAAKMNLKFDDLEGCGTDSRQELYLKLRAKCAASKDNRLPGSFTWEVRGPRQNPRSQCR